METNGDQYYMFFSAFAIDIIQPNIVLTKTVQNAAGVDIGAANVNLCDDLTYTIGFQNIGNDDAANFTIRDVLPLNVTFNPAMVVLPPPPVTVPATPPITFVYNAGTRTIVFTIPNGFVTVNAPRYELKLKVKVVCTCNELDDACSNLVTNQAFASYAGVIFTTPPITDDPSLPSFSACNLSPPNPTNFLVGLDSCDFKTDVVLCGNNPVTLTAANGYSSYVWSGPGTITPVAGTNNQSVTVTQIGTYTVNDIIGLSPCKSIVQTFNVIDFGSGALTNPVIPYADSVVICPNDGKPLPLIFLCGAADSQLIQTNISGAISIVWDQLNTASCAAVVNPNCANENPACTWTNVGMGANYTATAAGQYRVTINYPSGCSRVFYFNVFQNLLNPIATPRDVVCTTQGQITITGVPAGYEYQLNCAGAWQPSNVFTGLPAGVYSVCIRQTGIVGGCVFTLSNIPIVNRVFSVSAIITQPLCSTDKGSINLAANNVLPQYTFTINQMPGAVLVSSVGPTNSSSTVFNNLNPGNYTYTVTTQDGCTVTTPFTINLVAPLTATVAITKPLACTDGEITVYPLGGTPPYNYIVTGAISVTQGSPIIGAPVAGTYNIQVVDSNNCFVNVSITVAASPPPVFNIVKTDVVCSAPANTGSITINVTNANGSTILYSITGGAPFFVSNAFTNLNAGTYNVVLQYTLGTSVCTTPAQPITIIGATPIVGISTLTTPYTCTTSGVITVSGVGGGTGPYSYSIDGITYQVGNTFIITAAGTYTVIIKDSKGCTLATAPITVAPLIPPTDLSFSATALTCPANTSNVTLTVTGTYSPYTYQIIAPFIGAPQASNVFNGLSPNSYTFQVTDSKNCTYQENYTITPLPALNVVGTLVKNVKCFGTATGSATYTVTGSSGFTYTINGVPQGVGASPINLINLAAGTYTVVVTNTATNCTATASVTITGPATALLAPITPSPVTCLSNGQVIVTASGGWGGYTYTMAPMPVGVTQAGNVFSNIPAGGPYTVTTTDSGGCAVSNSFTLVAPTPPTATISAASNFCFSNPAGATIVVTPAGGVAPYTYTINGAPNATNVFSNLTPGSYTIVVRDAFGCTVTLPVQTIAAQLTLNTVLTKDLDCTASPNAVITLTVAGGYPGYTYQVNFNGGGFGASLPLSSNPFAYSTAVPGTYQFQITDTKGCNVQSGVFTINPLIPVNETHTQINNKCFGDTAGSVTITPSGGVAPYQINFNGLGFSSTFTYSGLAAGTYNFVVRDSKSCTVNRSVTITQQAIIAYTPVVNPITCNIAGATYNLGSICVTALSGGVAPYTYTLVDLTGGTPNQIWVDAVGANHCFLNIDFGLYDLSVTDANGCTIVKSNLTMSSPPSGLNFTFSSLASCAAGASLTVSISGGIIGGGPYEFGIVNLPAFPWSSTFAPANSPPATHLFTGLIPGAIYTIVVRDLTTGCYYFQTAPAAATNSTLTAVVTPKNVTCNGSADGSISFTLGGMGAGMTQFTYQLINSATNLPMGALVTINAPFTFPYTISPLPVGSYNVLVREINGANGGCGKTFGPYVISQSATLLSLTATTTNDNCKLNAGQISVSAQGGTAAYTYQYLPAGSPAPTAGSAGWVISNLFNGEGGPILGNYDVYVKDANDCIKVITVNIGLDPSPVITATLVNACVAQGTYQIFVDMPTAGIAPYTFSIDGGAFVANVTPFTISGLSSGAHSVEVSDKNGCGNKVNLNILTPLIVSAAFTVQPTCFNPDGTITVTASGGSASYDYTLLTPALVVIQGPQASNIFVGYAATAAGYIVRVRDLVTNCIVEIPFNPTPATLVTFGTITTPVSCNGGSDGTITVNLGAGNNDPVYTYQITAPIVVGPQTSNVFTGLAAQTYTVRVVSGRICPQTDNNVVVGTPSKVVASVVATPFTCAANNSVNVSVITVSGAFGTPAYTYSIDGINYFPTGTFNIIDNGAVQNFTAYVKDSKGCIDTKNISINPLPKITAVTVKALPTITCTNPELVTLTVTGGSGNFTYQALPPGAANVVQVGATNQFNISAPGSYTFQVNDITTGCYFVTAAHTVAPFNSINVVATATKPVTCFVDSDGAIAINVTGYSGTYNYQVFNNTTGLPVTPIIGANTAINPLPIIGLPSGNYTVQVSETASPFCVKVSNVVTVAGPSAALALTVLETANVTCTNNKGVITASATGGWGTYVYTMVPFPAGAVQTGNVFSNLPAGAYTITVRDLLNCSDVKPITLTAPVPISTIFTPSAGSVLCFGDNSVTISFPYPTGGQGSNYSYVLNSNNPTIAVSGPISIPLGATTNISGLGADTYSIVIIDGYNCTLSSGNIVIGQPSKVKASLTTTTTQTCQVQTVLTLTGSGGTPPYSYSTTIGGAYTPFVNPTTTPISVPVGTYHYFVKDANGCISDVSNDVTVTPLALLLIASLTHQDILCGGSATGTISATATGGLLNYVYTLLNGAGVPILPAPTQTTPGNFSNLPAGSYIVHVQSLDCPKDSPIITITEPTPFNVVPTSIPVKCNGGNDGAVNLVITGGTGTIQYAISPNLSQFITITNPYAVGGFNIPNLMAGSYTIIIQDQNGCFVTFNNYVIGQPTALTSNVASIVDEDCADQNLGEIHMTGIGGGTPPYTITYTVVYPGTTAVVTSPIIPLGVGVTTYDFLGLDGGAYNVIVTDGNGCKSENPLTVGSGVLYNPIAEVTFPCVGNKPSVRVEVLNLSNPPTFTFPLPSTDYLFSLDVNSPVGAQASNIFTSAAYISLLTPTGVPHKIYVFHVNGCDKATPVFTINATDVDALNISLVQVPLNQIIASLSPTTGGSAAYTYTFEDETGSVVQTGASNVYVYDHSATYKVTVTDSSGCSDFATIPVIFIPIKIINVYTPGDGGGWSPLNTSNYPNLMTRIYDRYGRLIAELPEGQKWYGKYNGQELPSGDYWYVIKVDESNAEEFVGHFTLYR